MPLSAIVAGKKVTVTNFDYDGNIRLGLTAAPWGMIDNRPFLRCMHGYVLCLWRLKKFEDAAKTFERMLWLNPTDSQGARLCIDKAREKTSWTPDG